MKSEPQSALNANSGAAVNRNPEKYQRILDAAVAVFAEKGFFTSRISDIADRANVADGTVYLYFKNKEEILMTAINTADWHSCTLTRWVRTVISPSFSRWNSGRARAFCRSSRTTIWLNT